MNSTYKHTQQSPLCLLLYTLGIVFMVLSWTLRNEPVIEWIFPCVAALILLFAASFHHLTVEDEGDALSVRFGPLPLFHRTIRYADIESAEPGRTTILDGWGIHMSLSGGWVWNLWGRDCVVLKLRKSSLRVGTDDVTNLANFLTTRLQSIHRNQHSIKSNHEKR
ncbi:hypothetical protein CA13_69540 [Planctomycetes bacterium CA13]|uniref:Bacterial Pleckstrin homology domain-containing protein n=1 Tax=Novipirellula herctigrandis TaxID=2527986 RepID=A0A5C5YNY7_9BACT|nr:hypothetical protein CA13_69540 [Planctomycetes bacterium CA13]